MLANEIRIKADVLYKHCLREDEAGRDPLPAGCFRSQLQYSNYLLASCMAELSTQLAQMAEQRNVFLERCELLASAVHELSVAVKAKTNADAE